MTNLEILAAFETEIGLIDNTFEKPQTDDSLFWLNQAIGKFTKLRFNGDFTHKQGYEQTEKRRIDLIRLVKSAVYGDADIINEEEVEEDTKIIYKNRQANYDQYVVTYPEDFLFALNEDVIICDNDGNHMMDTCVFECTRDSFMYRINNSLTDFHYRYHRARPLRIRDSKGCQLLTDKNYKVKQYTLGYIRKPKEITLQDPYSEYSDFEDIIMTEIIKIAAQMYLENIKNERYKTISEEVLTQE